MPASRPAPTYPLPKYGPTAIYGTCELAGCEFDARSTCPDCGGEFCLGHIDPAAHPES